MVYHLGWLWHSATVQHGGYPRVMNHPGCESEVASHSPRELFVKFNNSIVSKCFISYGNFKSVVYLQISNRKHWTSFLVSLVEAWNAKSNWSFCFCQRLGLGCPLWFVRSVRSALRSSSHMAPAMSGLSAVLFAGDPLQRHDLHCRPGLVKTFVKTKYAEVERWSLSQKGGFYIDFLYDYSCVLVFLCFLCVVDSSFSLCKRKRICCYNLKIIPLKWWNWSFPKIWQLPRRAGEQRVFAPWLQAPNISGRTHRLWRGLAAKKRKKEGKREKERGREKFEKEKN